jgi:hypothetical protein
MRTILGTITVIAVSITSLTFWWTTPGISEPAAVDSSVGKLVSVAEEARLFCLKKGYNSDFCLLADMSIHSGKNRFFVWDFNQQRVIHSMLVSHGCGDNPWQGDASKDSPTFSNVPQTYLSSLGRYLIGQRGPSSFGIGVKYHLTGLDPTNNNASRRTIVFHSWSIIPDDEIYPQGTPEGWGCPAISDQHFRVLDGMLRYRSDKTLLWMYHEYN